MMSSLNDHIAEWLNIVEKGDISLHHSLNQIIPASSGILRIYKLMYRIAHDPHGFLCVAALGYIPRRLGSNPFAMEGFVHICAKVPMASCRNRAR